MLITADHGNADEMLEKNKKGEIQVRTAHSLNPVPFIIYDKDQKFEIKVNGFNADDRSVHAAGVAYHVAVRVVAANEVVLAGPDSLDELVGDLSGLHPGSLVEAYVVGRDLAVGLKLLAYLAAAVAVPEVDVYKRQPLS